MPRSPSPYAHGRSEIWGRGTLKRVEQGSLAAVALRVTIEAPIEPELDLVVDDGDNPPLDVRAITAEFAELPWIYFEAPPGALAARYGNPSLSPPKYDLEAVSIRSGYSGGRRGTVRRRSRRGLACTQPRRVIPIQRCPGD